MDSISLDAILAEFDANEVTYRDSSKEGGPVTIWLTPDYKNRYDRLQDRTKRRFTKQLRKLIQAAIDRCEPKAS